MLYVYHCFVQSYKVGGFALLFGQTPKEHFRDNALLPGTVLVVNTDETEWFG
jgi:hypothetical protein